MPYPLLDTFLRAAVECVGARRGYLLLLRGADLAPFAEVTVDTHRRSTPYNQEREVALARLPVSLLDHVRRTRENVVLADATASHPFATDPYFSRQRPKSVLCLPIVHHGRLVGVLYFESNSITEALACNRFAAWETLVTHAASVLTHERLDTGTQPNAQPSDAESAWRESEERYRALYDGAPLMCFTVDSTGTVLSVNHFGATYLGYAPEELAGQSVLRLFSKTDRTAALEHVTECASEPERMFRRELRARRKDGNELWVRETARAVRGRHGTLEIIIVFEDITEYRRMQESARLSNRVMESTHNAIVIAKSSRAEDNPIIYVNPAFERVTGYSAAEMLGRDVRRLIGGDWEQPELERLRQAMRDGVEVRVVLRNYRKDGTLFWNELWFAPVLGEAREPTHFIGVINDVTDRMRYQQQLEHQANYDFLTGLANRNLLRDRLNQSLVQAQRLHWLVAVIFVDLDHFKVINDNMGHHAGDALISAVAQRLLGCVREVDTVARLGGDEFVVILPDAKKEDHVTATMQRIQEALEPPFVIDVRELYVTCSMGASICPRDGNDGETLLKNADIAMYRAKEMGRNTFQYHRTDVSVRAGERFNIRTSLQHALEGEELLLHFQPIMETASGKIVGAEALLRWRHPEEGMIPPTAFISVAEETGLIVPIGEWVLDRACRQARLWREHGAPSLAVAINLSARQLGQRNFADMVSRALEASLLDPTLLQFELTESTVMQHVDGAMAMARRLKALGVSLALDDFGTGYSSLSYLKRFPIDTIKIDGCFVRGIPSDADNTAIACAAIALARNLNIAVVAEGVETEEQFKFLSAKQCHQIQGHYISPPLEAAEFARFIRAGSTTSMSAA